MVGDYEYHKLKAQLAILEDVAKEIRHLPCQMPYNKSSHELNI